MNDKTAWWVLPLAGCLSLVGGRAAEPLVSSPVYLEPPVPEEWVLRWVPEDDWYKAASNLRSAARDGAKPETPLPEMTDALAAGKDEFAEVETFKWEPFEFREDFPNSKPRCPRGGMPELKKQLRQYLVGLIARARQPDASEKLRWYTLACLQAYDSSWPGDCRKVRFEENENPLEAVILRTPTDTDDPSDVVDPSDRDPEFRVSRTRIQFGNGPPWKIYDLLAGKWTLVPEPPDADRYDNDFMIGLADEALSCIHRQFDFRSGTWSGEDRGPIRWRYMQDPVRSGSSWIAMYKNPPHINEENAKSGPLTDAERVSILEWTRDRFYLIPDDGLVRELPVSIRVNQFLVTGKGRLCAVGGLDRFSHAAQIQEQLLTGDSADNHSLVKLMDGCFNGVWSAGDGDAESLVLDQFGCDGAHHPVRAAVYDLATRQWKLLWNDPKPSYPAPPPGVLSSVVNQPPAWNLPEGLTRTGVSCVRRFSPSLFKKEQAFLTCETRDIPGGTFRTDLWVFSPGSREPERIPFVLPGYTGGGFEVKWCERGLAVFCPGTEGLWLLEGGFGAGARAGK